MNSGENNFQNKTQSRKFLLATYLHNKPTIVGEAGRMGVFCDMPIIKTEYYVCDKEPVVEPRKGFRIIIWSRSIGTPRPEGWIEMRGGMRYTALAVVDLSLYGGTYYKAWSGSAKTSRNKWLHQSDTKIIETDIDTYMSYYDRSIVPNKMREIFKKQIYDYSKIYGNNVHFFLAQDKNTNQPLSGFCCVDDFEANQSLHLVAFRSEKNIPRYVGIGLINYWMEHLQRVGIRYANLGVVWQKGDPKSWIGYSDFKMHFSPKIHTFENPLFKIRWNR